MQYPVYFAFEDDSVNAVLADIKRHDATGLPVTATTGGWVGLTDTVTILAGYTTICWIGILPSFVCFVFK